MLFSHVSPLKSFPRNSASQLISLLLKLHLSFIYLIFTYKNTLGIIFQTSSQKLLKSCFFYTKKKTCQVIFINRQQSFFINLINNNKLFISLVPILSQNIQFTYSRNLDVYLQNLKCLKLSKYLKDSENSRVCLRTKHALLILRDYFQLFHYFAFARILRKISSL